MTDQIQTSTPAAQLDADSRPKSLLANPALINWSSFLFAMLQSVCSAFIALNSVCLLIQRKRKDRNVFNSSPASSCPFGFINSRFVPSSPPFTRSFRVPTRTKVSAIQTDSGYAQYSPRPGTSEHWDTSRSALPTRFDIENVGVLTGTEGECRAYFLNKSSNAWRASLVRGGASAAAWAG